MASNAWDRAQEAIAHAHRRATERHEDVVTPDNAVSPFDASSTTVLPHGLAARRGATPDPDLTQRLPQDDGHQRRGGGGNGQGNGQQPEDPVTVRLGAQRGPTHPGTSPFPAGQAPSDGDGGRAERTDDTPAPRRSWWRRLFGR